MTHRIYTGNIEEIEDRLNGSGVFGPFPSTGLPVGGLTLDFTTPATPVTFSGAAGAVLPMRQIVAEINAVIAGIASMRKARGTDYSASPDGGAPIVMVHLIIERAAGFVISGSGSADALISGAFTSTGAVTAAQLIGFTTSNTNTYAIILDV